MPRSTKNQAQTPLQSDLRGNVEGGEGVGKRQEASPLRSQAGRRGHVVLTQRESRTAAALQEHESPWKG